MKTLADIENLKGKRILFRADFDVPVGTDTRIAEPFRIIRQKEAVGFLADAGAVVVIVAHIAAMDSFRGLVPQISALIGRPLAFLETPDAIPAFLREGSGVALLDNIRRNPEEQHNDETFATRLATGFDLYVNNAFAVCHRDHASISAITRMLPSYAGPLLEHEVATLSEAIAAPARGKVIVMGGAKAATKTPVIKRFIAEAEAILVGGVIANDILKAKGDDIGASIADDNAAALLAGADLANKALVVPQDFVVDQGRYLDIGPASAERFVSYIKRATLVIWNGPMGMFEDDRFMAGTRVIAQAIADSGAKSIIGGGDTIAAVRRLGLLDRYSFVSTGGGAMLAFLAGSELPGLTALGYDNHA